MFTLMNGGFVCLAKCCSWECTIDCRNVFSEFLLEQFGSDDV